MSLRRGSIFNAENLKKCKYTRIPFQFVVPEQYEYENATSPTAVTTKIYQHSSTWYPERIHVFKKQFKYLKLTFITYEKDPISRIARGHFNNSIQKLKSTLRLCKLNFLKWPSLFNYWFFWFFGILRISAHFFLCSEW